MELALFHRHHLSDGYERRPVGSRFDELGELRVRDENRTWRIMYRVDPNAVVVIEVFAKTTRATPKHVIELCQRRLRDWDRKNT